LTLCLFLDTLAHFPLVYYMTESIWSVDDLLVARITQDGYLVVVKRNPDSNYEGEEFLEDSSTLLRHKSTSGSHLGEIFCLLFAVGHFFSASMLDNSVISDIHQELTHLFYLTFAGHLMENKVLDICQVAEGYSMMGSLCHHQASV
ncbi:potassium channel subfamily T member 2, partial [Biomphalaria glabrata]